MSKKIAILSAIMLVFGGISIPSGFIINNIMDDMDTDRMDDGLLGIDDQFILIGEDMILEMGPAIALPLIQEQALPIIEDMVYQRGPAKALDLIREEAVPIIEQEIYKIGPAIALQNIKENAISADQLRVYASFLTQFLYQAHEVGEDMSETVFGIYVDGGDVLLNLFFDYNVLYLGWDWFGGLGDTTFSEQLAERDLPPILGISQWWSREQGSNIDLEIGHCNHVLLVPQPDPNDLLAWGDPDQTGVDLEENDPPGFLQHREFGFGVLQFLEDYENAVITGDHASFLSKYNQGRTLEWSDFVIIARYFYEYWVPEAMPILLAELQDPSSEFSQRAPEYVSMDLDDISYHNFLRQWIDFTVYSAGLDLHDLVEELPEDTYGLEVDSTMSIESAYDLWDENNEWSFLSITGIKKWYDAYSDGDDKDFLESQFGLTDQEAQDILNWLWAPGGFAEETFPLLAASPEPYGYGATIEELSWRTFYELWAYGTSLGMELYPDGMDFGEFMPDYFDPGTTGFEVGALTPTEMSLELIEALWDDENEYSLTNMDGIEVWFDANSIQDDRDALYGEFSSLGLDYATVDTILEWLWVGSDSFSQDLLPIIIESDLGYGMEIHDLSEILLYEQWANGTFMEMEIFPNGLDFGEFIPDEFDIGTTGFEVGITTPTGITIDQIGPLWDTFNENSLINMIGIKRWHEANTNEAMKAILSSIFTLTNEQTNMILDWLWNGPDSFSQGLLPKLLESELGYGMPITDLAKRVMLEQWANGTILGMTMFEDGIDFHDFISSIPEGSKGFEVGIPVPTGMSLESALLLWDPSNPYSLVTDISVWRSIESKDSENYMIVRDANKLDDATIDIILEWLPDFIDIFMPALAQSEIGLPTDTTNLGNAILIGSMIVGAITIGLASTGIVSNMIISKKRKSVIKGDKTVKKFDKIIGNLRSLSQELHENFDSESIPIVPQSTLHDKKKFNKLSIITRYLSQELPEDLDSESIPITPQSKPRDD